MAELPVKYSITASSCNAGALGIWHLHAPEDVLTEDADFRVCPKNGLPSSLPLQDGELRYGWLRSRSGEILDEVMLAKVRCGMRVLMTHGGSAVREQLSAELAENGYLWRDPLSQNEQSGSCPDSPWDILLALSKTEAQAAFVLEQARIHEYVPEAAAATAADPFLRTRRMLLAGPPNAGKSSLLNHLAGYERAFVHAEAGATTDVVDEFVDIGGYAVLAGDMPGFAAAGTALERQAWDKAAGRFACADAVLFVCDGSQPWDSAAAEAAAETAARTEAVRRETGRPPAVMVTVNKSDMPAALEGTPWSSAFPEAPVLRVCSLSEGDALQRIAAEAEFLFGHR